MREAGIGSLPLPEGIGEEIRSAFARRGSPRSFGEGAVLWHAGGIPAGIHLVLDGEVKIVRSSGGRSHVIHRGERGAILGQVPLFARGGYPATAIATRPTRCLVVGRSTVVEAMRRDPAFAEHLLEGLAERVRLLVDRIDARSAQTVARRVAGYLWGRPRARSGEWFGLDVTQAELAQELGTVREVVVRELAELRGRGLLESDGRGRYRMPDPAAWEDMTNEKVRTVR